MSSNTIYITQTLVTYQTMATFNFHIVAIILFFSVCSAAAKEAPVTFVFGDSLTEVGNNNHLRYSLARANYLWYGVDYKDGRPTGRFSNGRTIGDIISAKLGIPSPPPFLSMSLNDNDILNGVNYASGGAGILNETGIYFIQKLTFDDQINCYEKTKAAINAKIGKEASDELTNRAVFFIGLGSNDYVNNFLLPFLPDGQQYTHDGFLNLISSTLDRQLKKLYGLGARKVVFHSLGPLGCIPSQRVKSRNGTCLLQVNQWALQFNARVKKVMDSLNSELPSAKFAVADSYDIVMDLIERPHVHGFKVSNTSCCNVDSVIGGLCLPSSKLCSNRSEYVFWDAFHPSDAANAVIAERLFADHSFLEKTFPAEAPGPTPAHAPAASPH